MLVGTASPSNSVQPLLDAEPSNQVCYLNCNLSRALSLSNSSHLTCAKSVPSKASPSKHSTTAVSTMDSQTTSCLMRTEVLEGTRPARQAEAKGLGRASKLRSVWRIHMSSEDSTSMAVGGTRLASQPGTWQA